MTDRIVRKSDVYHMVARASLGIKAVDGREPNNRAMEEFVREHWKSLQHKTDLSRPLAAVGQSILQFAENKNSRNALFQAPRPYSAAWSKQDQAIPRVERRVRAKSQGCTVRNTQPIENYIYGSSQASAAADDESENWNTIMRGGQKAKAHAKTMPGRGGGKGKAKGKGKDIGGGPPTLRCKWNEQILEEGCLEIAQIGELLEWEASDNGIAFVTSEEFYQGFPHEPMSGPKAALLPITWEKALAIGGLEEGEMKEKTKKCADFICRYGVRITVPTRDPRSNEVFPKETVMISVGKTKTEWTGEAATHSCENKVAHKPSST